MFCNACGFVIEDKYESYNRCDFCGSLSYPGVSGMGPGPTSDPSIIIPWVEAYDNDERQLLNLTSKPLGVPGWEENISDYRIFEAKVPSAQYDVIVGGDCLSRTRHWRQVLVEIVKAGRLYSLISLDMGRPWHDPNGLSQLISPTVIREVTYSHGLEICDCRFPPSRQLWLFRKVDPCAGF